MLSVLSGRIVLLVSGWSVLAFKMPEFVGLFICLFAFVAYSSPAYGCI
jgi:hypothetical protein